MPKNGHHIPTTSKITLQNYEQAIFYQMKDITYMLKGGKCPKMISRMYHAQCKTSHTRWEQNGMEKWLIGSITPNKGWHIPAVSRKHPKMMSR